MKSIKTWVFALTIILGTVMVFSSCKKTTTDSDIHTLGTTEFDINNPLTIENMQGMSP